MPRIAKETSTLAGELEQIAGELKQRAGDLTVEMNALLSDIADRRQFDRYDSNAPITVTVNGKSLATTIDNISGSGACIVKVPGLEMRQDIRLAFEDGCVISGRVMWINDRLCGVAFEGVTLPSSTISRVRAPGSQARAA